MPEVHSQQGNFLKCITYCDKVDVDSAEIVNYLENLGELFIAICSLRGFIRELSAVVHSFQGRERQYVNSQLLYVRYFDGDFDSAFAGIKQLAPLELLATLDRSLVSERLLAYTAYNIYLMEGEALCVAKYDARHKVLLLRYPSSLFYLGEYNQSLAESYKHNFFNLEVLANMGLLAIEVIDAYLSELYDKAHLQLMQVSYIRSKLVPLERHEIVALVTVNPYARGLKGLMLAFIEPNAIKANKLYQEAIQQLGHIKYYHVEALYFYAKFLQTHNPTEFDIFYRQGLNLTQKHHYRFLQYRFEQLLHPSGIAYDPRNYPLPDNENFDSYIQFLIKKNKERKDSK
ncbi:MAG: hypothetical protein KKC76_19075 [Proteobacteria bacterium]|nr:hypothetical protein [Pseudomonadota bacterium]MBU4295923.1 hypothetical protein [Pseudomonadota bacterium]MCG2746131.1 hypothetical protein [Desulfobulbaceae bacterium]